MGAGKSSVGERLARLQGWPLFETDTMVAHALGMPVSEIFSAFGEERFRDEETTVLQKLEPAPPSIIVTGGGAVLRPRNVVRLHELGRVVCLTADLATLQERLLHQRDRPLLQTTNPVTTIARLLREREPLYREAADLMLDTSSLSPDRVAESILHALAISD